MAVSGYRNWEQKAAWNGREVVRYLRLARLASSKRQFVSRLHWAVVHATAAWKLAVKATAETAR